jgi:hypothetical protein
VQASLLNPVLTQCGYGTTLKRSFASSWIFRLTCRPGHNLAILSAIYPIVGVRMSPAQRLALQNYRSRLAARGMTRFEVLGREGDRDLIRTLARRLAEGDAEAVRIRAEVDKHVSNTAPTAGGIVAALRRSPLVGADLNLKRTRTKGRKVAL